MPDQTLLPGITMERVPTRRLTMAVLSAAGRTGQPVLFVHGNVSSSLFWQPTMLALPDGYRPLAVDLRGFGDTDQEPVDATRGLGDYADDLAALIEALGLARCTSSAGAWAAALSCSTWPSGPPNTRRPR